jgi:hypothetical protein
MSADSRRHVEIPVFVCLISPVYVVCMEDVTPRPADLSVGQQHPLIKDLFNKEGGSTQVPPELKIDASL